MYERAYGDERILVICSFAGHDMKYRLPKAYKGKPLSMLLDNYPGNARKGQLRPYEVKALCVNGEKTGDVPVS